MIKKKIVNEYDDIKNMLNKVRKIQSTPKYGLLGEQEEEDRDQNAAVDSPEVQPQQQSKETSDIAVVNNLEIKVNSNDPEALEISEDEKGKVSQLVDDFRTNVSEMVDFGTLQIYPNSAKLDGRISNNNLGFMFSAGDDTGLYLSNISLLKIDDQSFDIINKLKAFQDTFTNTINDLLVNRKNM